LGLFLTPLEPWAAAGGRTSAVAGLGAIRGLIFGGTLSLLVPKFPVAVGTSALTGGRTIRIWYRMHPDAANPLLPIATLAAGVFLMIAPRVVSFAVAVYLVFVGLLGLERDLSSREVKSR
jgi:hypothetical protein